MSDVVLVHDSTQSAAGFWRLTEALARRGHRVLTVAVPSTAAVTSIAYAELLDTQLPADLHRPVIAAHSAAGLLLPALAERLDAAHLVWLAAAVADYTGGPACSPRSVPTRPRSSMRIGSVSTPPSDPVAATYFLFHDADLATLRQALPTVARCDLTAVYAEIPPVDPATRPSTYLLPVEDRVLTRAGMLRMARERLGVDPVEVPGGHNTYVATPRKSPRSSTRQHDGRRTDRTGAPVQISWARRYESRRTCRNLQNPVTGEQTAPIHC